MSNNFTYCLCVRWVVISLIIASLTSACKGLNSTGGVRVSDIQHPEELIGLWVPDKIMMASVPKNKKPGERSKIYRGIGSIKNVSLFVKKISKRNDREGRRVLWAAVMGHDDAGRYTSLPDFRPMSWFGRSMIITGMAPVNGAIEVKRANNGLRLKMPWGRGIMIFYLKRANLEDHPELVKDMEFIAKPLERLWLFD